MKTMQARFPGYCARTGARILPGDTIDYHGRNRAILRARAGAGAARPDLDAPEIRDADLQLAVDLDPDLAHADPEAAQAAGRYLRQGMARSVSDHIVIGGQSFYRNKRGRCEDAPCCGCCTI